MRKAGRDIDPGDLPPDLDWEREIWTLYERIRTQWRYGFNGPQGLDYNPAIKLIEHHGYDLEFALDLLQAIEATVMEERAKKAAANKT